MSAYTEQRGWQIVPMSRPDCTGLQGSIADPCNLLETLAAFISAANICVVY